MSHQSQAATTLGSPSRGTIGHGLKNRKRAMPNIDTTIAAANTTRTQGTKRATVSFLLAVELYRNHTKKSGTDGYKRGL